MNLYNLVNTIKNIALSEHNVNQFISGDIYQLNTLPSVKYSVVCLSQQEHREDDDFKYYTVNIFYVDRLLADESNRLDIQSHGEEILENILDNLETGGAIIGEHTFHVFNQKFADLCAGVYVNVTIQIPVDDCFNMNIVNSINGKTGDVILDIPSAYTKTQTDTLLAKKQNNLNYYKEYPAQKVANISTSASTLTVTPQNIIMQYGNGDNSNAVAALPTGIQLRSASNMITFTSTGLTWGSTTITEEQLKKLLALIK